MIRALWFAMIVGLATPSFADDDVHPTYTRSVSLIERLYLHDGDATPSDLLRAAAQGLAAEVDWLMVDVDDGTIRLKHGRGRTIASASASTYASLPLALQTLEEGVANSGFDTADVDVRLTLIDGMTDALDRYSRVLAGDGLERFDTRLTGTLTGIGVTVRRMGDDLTVSRVVKNGPAARAGVKDGDVIVGIDDRNTINMPVREAMRRIRGETGTRVDLALMRDGAKVNVGMRRAEVVLENVHGRVLDGDIGYVKIDHISQKTVRNLRASLTELRQEGALGKGLVLDLRGNTGGSMKEAARCADQFLEDGLLLKTVGRGDRPVPNLVARIEAVDAGDEPPIPMIVLVDHRSASGAEIIAGALLEHERVAIVGSRTYGKGEVQKIYTLDSESRLKLTVAEYVLAGDRRVAGNGIVPDVTLGRIRLDDRGARFVGWDPEDAQVPWNEIVPVVDERRGWAGKAVSRHDVALDLARRALLRSKGAGRTEVLTALGEVLPNVRQTQESRLSSAFAHKGVDWTAATRDGDVPQVDVRVAVSPSVEDPDVQVVSATVTNRGAEPLHRALVQVDSETFRRWNRLAIPVGYLAPGETAVGRLNVSLPAGIAPREDQVDVALRADRRPVHRAAAQIVSAESRSVPRIRVQSRLIGDGAQRRAEVHVQNLGDRALHDVEAYFQHPNDVNVELLDRASWMPTLPAQGTGTFSLALALGDNVPDDVPLRLVLDAEGFGSVGTWDLYLPKDGHPVVTEAPRIDARPKVLSATVGEFVLPITAMDDESVQSVEVYLNGDKSLWVPGGRPRVDVRARLQLDAGPNEVVVHATDADGHETTRRFSIRGVAGTDVVDDDQDGAAAVPGSRR